MCAGLYAEGVSQERRKWRRHLVWKQKMSPNRKCYSCGRILPKKSYQERTLQSTALVEAIMFFFLKWELPSASNRSPVKELVLKQDFFPVVHIHIQHLNVIALTVCLLLLLICEFLQYEKKTQHWEEFRAESCEAVLCFCT